MTRGSRQFPGISNQREESGATATLLRGAKPKVIAEALGHASVAFTMDTYSHIISGVQEDMMALLDEVLPSGVPRTSKERQDEEVHDYSASVAQG